MQIDWTLEELDHLERFLGNNSPLRTAIAKFCAAKKQEADENSASAMRTIPRQFERASDYASQSDVYAHWLTELDRQRQKASSGGPTA
jgi:hypothetical protein